MAQRDLITKLTESLSSPLSAECHLVYVLVQVRKLLEGNEKLKNALASLNLCCNWAVHSKLERSQAQELVKEVDTLFGKYLANETSEVEREQLLKILNLESFRQQLLEFLKAYALPSKWQSLGFEGNPH